MDCARQGRGFGDIRVMLVNDCAATRRALRGQLRKIGVVEVEEADESAEAIDKLGFFHADLVICARGMRPVGGVDFARRIRRGGDGINPFVPILMLTDEIDDGELDEAVAAGINDVLVKPISPDTVHQRIASIMSVPVVFIRDGRGLRPQRCAPRRVAGRN